MKIALNSSQVVQWRQISPKTFILLRLGWQAFSKSSSRTSIVMVPSKLKHANKRNEWGQKSVCFGKESFSKKEHAVVGTLQRPGFLWSLSFFFNQTRSLQEHIWCGEGKVYLRRKLPMSVTLRKVCGQWWPTSWTWALRTRQKQMTYRSTWSTAKRWMKNWTRSTVKYEH